MYQFNKQKNIKIFDVLFRIKIHLTVVLKHRVVDDQCVGVILLLPVVLLPLLQLPTILPSLEKDSFHLASLGVKFSTASYSTLISIMMVSFLWYHLPL